MTKSTPVPIDGRDVISRDKYRAIVAQYSSEIVEIFQAVKYDTKADTARLVKYVRDLDNAGQQLLNIEVKLSYEESKSKETCGETDIDFDAMRQSIGRRLDRLRRAQGPKDFIKELTEDELRALPWIFEFWAMEHQLPPDGDWRTWVILGGRGAGKTRAGSEWIRQMVEGSRPKMPGRCAPRAIVAMQEFHADCLVAEVNQGGDMVQMIVATLDPLIPFTGVHAARGKAVRAEPVAALYEQGRVIHGLRIG